ncbi:MAG: hypothetical protein AMXMBFR33_22250 [Candidatus Xenobia bacterium]
MLNLRCILVILCLTLAGLAQDQRQILLLPVAMLGDYQPGSGQEFTQDLITDTARMAPNAKLVLARPADLAGLQYQAQDQPPSSEEAARLCSAYSTTNAVWLQCRFTPEYQPPVGGQPGVLTVAGGARFWAFRASDRKVVIDQPLSVVRSTVVPVGTDDATLAGLTQKLNSQCMNQLAQQVITVAQQQSAQQRTARWGAPDPAATGFSAAYQAMAASIQRYQQDVNEGDLIGTTDTQRQCLTNWRALSANDQALIEKNYPGTTQWMEGGVYYDVGYPYYYGGRRR